MDLNELCILCYAPSLYIMSHFEESGEIRYELYLKVQSYWNYTNQNLIRPTIFGAAFHPKFNSKAFRNFEH
jgi:hypothetical protein